MIYSSLKKLKVIFTLIISFYGMLSGASLNENLIRGFVVNSYKAMFRKCSLSDGSTVTQIRKFQIQAADYSPQDYALVVTHNRLETSVVLVSSLLKCREASAPITESEIQGAPSAYLLALAQVSAENINSLSNAGATHEENQKHNVYLTVDLCPSHKPLDVELFKKIQGGVKPVPVVISISGIWLRDHTSDLNLLLQMESEGELKITWANHTYSHPYDPKLPLEHNFLLEKNVSLEEEVFKNEKLLLSNGLVPSVFFRFPGLISDQEDVEAIRAWGLIPVGANAWLAKGQKPQIGSFILVHGNGNEPQGLKILYEDMQKNPELKNEFSDIHEAFDQ